MGEKVIASSRIGHRWGGLAIVACTKELGNYHIVARNSQFHQFGGGFYAGGNKEVI
jgi:hypothetical protein